MKKIIFSIVLLFINLPIHSEEHPKVILVLGSGGCRGLAHVGVIEELEKLKIIPDMIVGCSSGAIVGALYAQHKDIGKVKECLIHRTQDDFVDFSLFVKSAISTRDKLEAFIEENLEPKDFSSLKLPLIVVATNLQTGKPEYFNEGELAPAVLSSAALPLLFPPYKMKGHSYLDGGICDPLPISYARSLDEKAIIIASDISCSLDAFDIENLPQVVSKAFEIGYQHLANMGHEKANILLQMNFSEGASPIDDGVNEKLYEKGKQAVLDKKDEIAKAVKG